MIYGIGTDICDVRRIRAVELARPVFFRGKGAYLVGRSVPRPGARGPSGPNLAVLQEALAEAGDDRLVSARPGKLDR